jgi:chemotaxis methyl-accepting protein methylase/signal transduction histidine kinase/PAS domain-containing protein
MSETNDGSDQNQPASTAQDGQSFPVVGLGASAGGLKALKEFFTQMPAESGMAFVVIMHLSPQHESHAAAILQTTTRMTVSQVTEVVRVEPNHVYVIPPTMNLAMSDGHIRLFEPERPFGRHVAIDLFFRTLADTHGTHAVCIVLSGTGADGSIGIKRVKEAGGLAMVQAPGDAEYDAMPRNAINTGMVDFVLPVVELPDKLLEIWRNAQQIQLPVEAETPVVDESKVAEQALREVLTMLRTRTGHDFTHYKRATILRRIERRMQVNTLPDLPTYRDYLRTNPSEAQLLLKDLLIGVTNFFRDRISFDAFEREAVAQLFAGKTMGDQVRVWVAGCATGEEAYSIAMLLLEQASGLPNPPGIQLFATDIDEEAIAAARLGSYSDAIEADVSPARLRHFFTKEPGGYRVNKEVRERVLFAVHNLIKDPPFSKLDAITCRNLLIYLNREVQEQIFALFHFALRPNALLFLGASESADSAPTLFTAFDKKNRLYRAIPTRQERMIPTLPLEAPSLRLRDGRARNAIAARHRLAFGELHQQLLEQYAPPSVIVNADYEIVHLSEHVGRFLRLAGGEPSLNLLRAVLPELRLELRSALFQAMQSGRSTEAHRVRLVHEGRNTYVNMIVRPVQSVEMGSNFALVLFAEVEEALGPEGKEPMAGTHEPMVRGLEEELSRAKEQLQSTVEQYETSVEELKASNEELQVINEELRSTTEELETSKEELQSVNEELRTVNEELKNKVEEVSQANDDLQNLMASTDIPTIFLDRALHIKRYTPGTLALFRLIPTDTGRPLSDITHKLNYTNLHTDAEAVIASSHKIEREVVNMEGRHYLTRLAPYRTAQERMDGVVLTFVDITERKRHEVELTAVKDELAADLDAMTNLHEFSTRLLSTTELQSLLEEILAATIAMQRADFGLIQLGDSPSGALIIVAQQGFAPDVLDYFNQTQAATTAAGRVRQQRTHIIIEDVELDADYAPHRSIAAASDFRAVQATPMFNHAGEILGILSTYFRAVNRPSPRDRRLTDLFVRVATVLIERKRSEVVRHQLFQQLVNAQEEERQRIARELHDSLGQHLATLHLGLKSIQDRDGFPRDVGERIQQLRELALQIDDAVDRLVFDLHPPALDDLGLEDALRRHVQGWTESSGIPVDLHLSGLTAERLPPVIETTLYRIVQEALTNVLKHAGATHVSLILERRRNEVRLILEDNGRGFDLEAVRRVPASGRRLGLQSMEERAAQVGGRFDIETTPAAGTTLYVDVPLVNEAQRSAIL